MAFWYCGSTKWTAVTVWPSNTAVSAGSLIRQNAAPTVGNERVFVCIIAGTTTNVTEPTWTITKGGKTTDNTATWQECTGKAGVNGDLTNTVNWTAIKNTNPGLGFVIQRNSGGSLQICTTAGTTGNGAEPSFSNTAGVTTADNGATWTSLGAPSNFAAFAAPWARLNLGMASGNFTTLGDTIFVSNNHAETQASTITYNNLTAAGSTTITPVYCVSDAVAPPTTLATTGTVTTTGANALTVGGNIYVNGLNFSSGTGASSANLIITDAFNSNPSVFENCGITLGTSAAGSLINLNNSSGSGNQGLYYFDNCTFAFGATGQTFKIAGRTRIRNPTFAQTGSVPTTAFTLESDGSVKIEDSNLSKITGTLFGSAAQAGVWDVWVANCQLGAGVTVVSGAPTNYAGPRIRLHNSDSSNTNYRYYYSAPGAVVKQETTIVRTGGSTDGTTPVSWNITTDATPTLGMPFISEDLAQWNNTSGSALTAIVYLTTNTQLFNNTCWLEIEYPSSSSFPLGSTISTRMTPLGSPAQLTTDTSTWGGGALTFTYKISSTFTPLSVGPIKFRLYVAALNSTIYFDPYISGVGTPSREYLVPEFGRINETSSGGSFTFGS